MKTSVHRVLLAIATIVRFSYSLLEAQTGGTFVFRYVNVIPMNEGISMKKSRGVKTGPEFYLTGMKQNEPVGVSNWSRRSDFIWWRRARLDC